MVEIGFEAREIVLKNELAEELRILDLNGDVPRGGDDQKKRDTRKPERALQQWQIASRNGKNPDDDDGEKGRDRALRESTQGEEGIEESQTATILALMPCIPSEQRDREGRGKRHVHR